MYDVINITMPETFNEATDYETYSSKLDEYYTEAVFVGGKQKIEPLEEVVKSLKKQLDDAIATQTKDPKKSFDPKKFWKDLQWKDFEDQVMKIFGFRNVSINPYNEKYNEKTKEFDSKELNAVVYNDRRFPVSGLVTDEGFYDKSHSLRMEIYISLGLLQKLTAKEVIAVFLHEFGHSVDPALTDIKYVETNILSKYLTDRIGSINKDEHKYMKDNRFGSKFRLFRTCLAYTVKNTLFGGIFDSSKKAGEKHLKKLQALLKADNKIFQRQTFSEAYADNFARMYGYGPSLMSGLQKVDKYYDDKVQSRFNKEKKRQVIIMMMTSDAIKDVHRTDIHRCKALIKEYKADINNSDTPAIVKKQLESDLHELEKVMDAYFNNFSEFQNNVNKLIASEIDELEKKESNKK